MASPPTCLPCSPEFRITNDTLSRRRQLLPPFFSSNQKKKKKKKEKPSLVLQHRFTRGPNSGSSRPVPVANGPRGPTVGASHTKREAKGCRPLEQQRREERRGKERKREEKRRKQTPSPEPWPVERASGHRSKRRPSHKTMVGAKSELFSTCLWVWRHLGPGKRPMAPDSADSGFMGKDI